MEQWGGDFQRFVAGFVTSFDAPTFDRNSPDCSENPVRTPRAKCPAIERVDATGLVIRSLHLLFLDWTRIVNISTQAFALTVALIMTFPVVACADESGPPTPVSGNLQLDPGFAPWVNLQQLGDAWTAHDAPLLTDIALLMAEGEQVLQRTHPFLSANDVFSVAIGVAAEYSDNDTLTRLRSAVTDRDAALQDQLAAASLAATSRSISSHPSIDLETLSPEELTTWQVLRHQIRSGRINQDRRWMEELSSFISTYSELPEALKEHLNEQLTTSLAELPEQAADAETAAEPQSRSVALMQLTAASRGRRLRQGSGNRFLGNFQSQVGRHPRSPQSGGGRVLGQIDLGGLRDGGRQRGIRELTPSPRDTRPSGRDPGVQIIDFIFREIDEQRNRRDTRPDPGPQHNRHIIYPQPQPQFIRPQPQPQIVRPRPQPTPSSSVRSNKVPKRKPAKPLRNARPLFAALNPIDAEAHQLATDLVKGQTGKAINEMEDQLGAAAQDPEVARILEEMRAKAENGEAVTADDMNTLIDALNARDPAVFPLPPGFDENALADSLNDVMDLSEAHELLQQQNIPGGGFNPGFPAGPVLVMPLLPPDMQFLMPDGSVLMGTGGQGSIQIASQPARDLLDMNLGVGEPQLEFGDEFVDSGILIRNPPENGTTVHYLLSGVDSTLQSGEEHSLPSGGSRLIRFDSGVGGRELKFSLSQGTYVFRLDETNGWSLLKQTFQVTIDNSENDEAFYLNVDGRQEEIAAAQQRTFRSDFPIGLEFDRGNGGSPARKQVTDRETTLVVAASPDDGLWDLYPHENFDNVAPNRGNATRVFQQAMLKERLRKALGQTTPQAVPDADPFLEFAP